MELSPSLRKDYIQGAWIKSFGAHPSEITVYKPYFRELLDDLLKDYFLETDVRYRKVILRLEKKLADGNDSFKNINSNAVLAYSSFFLSWALLTNPEKISADVTGDSSVFFTVMYPGKNAYFELFFAKGQEEPEEVVYNVYQDKIPVDAYSGKFTDTLKAFFKNAAIHVPVPLD